MTGRQSAHPRCDLPLASNKDEYSVCASRPAVPPPPSAISLNDAEVAPRKNPFTRVHIIEQVKCDPQDCKNHAFGPS